MLKVVEIVFLYEVLYIRGYLDVILNVFLYGLYEFLFVFGIGYVVW